MIKNILLDMDNTLFDFDRAEHTALRQTLSQLEVQADEAALSLYSPINRSVWQSLERGEITRDHLKVLRFELFFRAAHIDADPSAAALLYEQALSRGHWYMPGATELLDALYGRYRLYVASNGTALVQRGRLEGSRLLAMADGIFISEEIGCNKPGKAFFEYIFARIPDFRREETLIVGDSLTSDIQGGKNAGIRTVWFHPRAGEAAPDPVPDYEIRELSELPALLRRL